MDGAFFILPNGDAVPSLHIGGYDGKRTYRVTAAGVIELQRQAEHWRTVAAELEKGLTRERDRIRRLLDALAGEVK